MKDKSDPESGSFVEKGVTGTVAAGRPVRNRDGLLIPSNYSFKFLVSLYTWLLLIYTVLLVLAAFAAVGRWGKIDEYEKALREEGNPDKKNKRMEEIRQLMPAMWAALVLLTMHNIIAWRGMITMSLRFIYMDLIMQCVFLVLGVMVAVMSDSKDYAVFFICQLIGIGIINVIGQSILSVNKDKRSIRVPKRTPADRKSDATAAV